MIEDGCGKNVNKTKPQERVNICTWIMSNNYVF